MSEPKKGSNGTAPPVAKIPGKESLRPPLPKRFYKSVTVVPRENGFAVLLDGKGIKTPAKKDLVLPTKALADAIAAEWTAQTERIDPDTMPLTRIANTAIDAVSSHMREVAADISAFAGNDLLCYRASGPEGLIARQNALWNPVLDWARDELGAALSLAEGVIHVAQPKEALVHIERALEGLDPFRLACLHVITTLTGSALIALAHARGKLNLEEAWAAAHVDEDWQIEHWGKDAEADARRMKRFAEFEAASRMMSLLG
jgi:chaperone required for assembly of F1-ATPase